MAAKRSVAMSLFSTRSMKKIKAYTLMELIVVMIITLVVVSITYKAFDIVLGQYGRVKSHNERIHELLVLETLLTKDFNDSDHVLRVPGGIVCSYEERNIRYDFDEQWIVRTQQTMRDTFHLATGNVEFQLLNSVADKPGAYVERLNFDAENSGVPLSFRYVKQYGADVLLGGHLDK